MTDHASFDFFVQWHLTERCNLRCGHCYQSGDTPEEMPLDAIREGIDEIASTLDEWSATQEISFAPSFSITGGEPLLRSDLYEIIGEIRRRTFDVFLLTNGTLIDEPAADRLAELGVRGVQVSMEGPEEIHDAIRGPGSFSAALKGIRKLLATGVTVTLNATLSHRNASFMPDLVTIASFLGVHRLGFSRIVPCGRGSGMTGDMLSPAQVYRLYYTLLSLNIDNLELVTGDPLAAQMGVEVAMDTGYTAAAGCAAAVSGITLLADGTMIPCRRLPVPIGNLRRDSLREVWATSDVLAALRDRTRYTGKCGRCRRWAACRGCRAVAYAFTNARGEGDFLAEDPQCFIEP